MNASGPSSIVRYVTGTDRDVNAARASNMQSISVRVLRGTQHLGNALSPDSS